MGKRVLAEPKPEGFNASIHTVGAMRRFLDKCREHDAAVIARAIDPSEAGELRQIVSELDAWLDRFIVNLKG